MAHMIDGELVGTQKMMEDFRATVSHLQILRAHMLPGMTLNHASLLARAEF
ncbi:MAG: hypothetical protein CM15mP125_0990 [Gammaproteobacteria bacterium]|nr:MAG: hypothetical protein CM15mP125_0990 [Gammaproteobacteria bacterium]